MKHTLKQLFKEWDIDALFAWRTEQTAQCVLIRGDIDGLDY